MTGDLQSAVHARIAVEAALIPVVDDAQAIEACLRARADQLEGADRLRRVITAGALLADVPRNPGARALSTDFTRLERIIEQAGISRQTAYIWQRAAAIDGHVVEDYICATEIAGQDVTLAGLMKWAKQLDGADTGTDDGAEEGHDDQDPQTHVCPHCSLLFKCDRSER